jgi:hypothetical protein
MPTCSCRAAGEHLQCPIVTHIGLGSNTCLDVLEPVARGARSVSLCACSLVLLGAVATAPVTTAAACTGGAIVVPCADGRGGGGGDGGGLDGDNGGGGGDGGGPSSGGRVELGALLRALLECGAAEPLACAMSRLSSPWSLPHVAALSREQFHGVV